MAVFTVPVIRGVMRGDSLRSLPMRPLGEESVRKHQELYHNKQHLRVASQQKV